MKSGLKVQLLKYFNQAVRIVTTSTAMKSGLKVQSSCLCHRPYRVTTSTAMKSGLKVFHFNGRRTDERVTTSTAMKSGLKENKESLKLTLKLE